MTFSMQYKEEQKRALETLRDWAGSISQLARIAGTTPAAAGRWFTRGRISSKAAKIIAAFPGCPLTKEEMRPDIKVWA